MHGWSVCLDFFSLFRRQETPFPAAAAAAATNSPLHLLVVTFFHSHPHTSPPPTKLATFYFLSCFPARLEIPNSDERWPKREKGAILNWDLHWQFVGLEIPSKCFESLLQTLSMHHT